jgi:CRP/FNR family cyclic AMP-dependent transcriptional regulator
MKQQKIKLQVCETADCPMYRVGDVFAVSGIAVVMENDEAGGSLVTTTIVKVPDKRKNCRVLGADLNRLVIEHERADLIPEGVIMCSGCIGSAVLEFNRDDQFADEKPSGVKDESSGMLCLLQSFPFFRNIDRYDLKNVVQSFKKVTFEKDEIIIRKGDQGDNFYIVVSGSVTVLNDAGLSIAKLGAGEVFGEMSLLSEECVSATVQADESCEIMYVDNREFKKLLNKYPILQHYFTRLLAKRLSKANRYRSIDFVSIMVGKLEEFPPEALFQSLHATHKTGILTITQLPAGIGRFSLRQGALIKASYKGKKGKTAFYEILKEKEGLYKFTPGLPPEDFDAPEIGYFMKLLMVGLQKAEKNN